MDSFQLKDGDRVVFLGDSLTASRAYGEIVERYTLQAYPNRHITFFNAGVGGDTTERVLKRLQRDVLSNKPTVVTLCLGINDIGWGTNAGPASLQKYYDGMREITRRCQKAGARVYMLGPCATNLDDNVTEESDADNLLSKMSAVVHKNAKEMGAIPINLHDDFRQIEWKIRKAGHSKDFRTHAPDGIHLGDLGNLIFAYVLLKGLGAPDSVSDLAIDVSSAPTVKTARRCQVTDLAKEGNTLRFTRLDEGWPMYLGGFAWFNFPYVPTNDKLSGYTLKVTGLTSPSGWFKIRLNGEELSTVTLTDLEKGANMAYMAPEAFSPFPPWRAQSGAIEVLTRAHTQVSEALNHIPGIAAQEKPFTQKLMRDTRRQVRNVEKLQQEAAVPRSLKFEIIPAEAPPVK